MKLIAIIILSIVSFYAFSNDASDPRFKAVQKYLVGGEDYPELFNDKSYRIQVNGIAIGDLDADGEAEVVMMVKPHYRQSPTIIIFRVDSAMNVTRVIEGLAPGPVREISGDYIDSHTLGLGVDYTAKAKNGEKLDSSSMVTALLQSFGNGVEYKNWFHADQRSGKKMYIDMKHIENENAGKNCAEFEFSEVKSIRIEERNGDGNFLIAYVGKNLYVYKIKNFLGNGLIEKEVAIYPD